MDTTEFSRPDFEDFEPFPALLLYANAFFTPVELLTFFCSTSSTWALNIDLAGNSSMDTSRRVVTTLLADLAQWLESGAV
jgi:hypothetical protein